MTPWGHFLVWSVVILAWAGFLVLLLRHAEGVL